MLIRVLGPVEIETPSGLISVGGRRMRALLGALTIGAGHAIPIDQLRWVLWADDPPAKATNTLQTYISHLRDLLGPEAIATVDHAYELKAGPDDIDALRFEVLLRRAALPAVDPETRRRLCGEALDLWRGRPFGDLADDEPFRLEACRLDELRAAAMQISLEADLECGRPELVISELESAVKEHPYRENLWLLLIEALAKAGRRTEALRECQELRTILRDVGLVPGDRLEQLEQQILE